MDNYPVCDRCGRQILPGKTLGGRPTSAVEVAQSRVDMFGTVLCDGCASDEVAKMAQAGTTPQQLIGKILAAGVKGAERKGEFVPGDVKSLIGALEADDRAPYKVEPKRPAPAGPALQDILKARMAAAAQAQEEAILGGFTPRTGPSKVTTGWFDNGAVMGVDYGKKPAMTVTVEPGPKVPDIKFKKFTPREYAAKLYGDSLAGAMYVGSIVVAEVPTDLTRNEVGLSIAECAEIFGLDVVEVKSSSPNQIAFRIIDQVVLEEDEDEDDDY